jgi:hypothetical protein
MKDPQMRPGNRYAREAEERWTLGDLRRGRAVIVLGHAQATSAGALHHKGRV